MGASEHSVVRGGSPHLVHLILVAPVLVLELVKLELDLVLDLVLAMLELAIQLLEEIQSTLLDLFCFNSEHTVHVLSKSSKS